MDAAPCILQKRWRFLLLVLYAVTPATFSSSNSAPVHKRTKLSGYGSHHKTHSHRHHHHHHLAPTNHTRLFLSRDEQGWIITDETTTNHTPQVSIRIHLPCTTTATTSSPSQLQSSFDHVQWVSSQLVDDKKRKTKKNKKKKKKDSSSIPVEGLFGVYSLPSGELWVWIASSKQAYSTPWLHIRHVKSLHLVHVSRTTPEALSRAQQQEEARQLLLLRQALKDHDWYFCRNAQALNDNSNNYTDNTVTNLVPDMTRSMQQCFSLHSNSSTNSSSNCMENHWWRPVVEAWKQTSINDTMMEQRQPPTVPFYPDRRFFWNEAVLEGLLLHLVQNQSTKGTSSHNNNNNNNSRAVEQLLQWSIPVTSAFVGVQRNVSLAAPDNDTKTKTKPSIIQYDQLLISRRSKYRAGTRFTKRGADATGNVANYAETEQIVLVSPPDQQPQQQVFSHVQTRGSIPLRWSSPTDIKTYRPRVRLGSNPLAQARAMRQHLVDQTSRFILDVEQERKYPGLVLVNLVDKKSDQGRLGRAMDAVLQAVLDVYTPKDSSWNAQLITHHWFDFHAQVKGGRWDNLKTLLVDLQPTLQEQSFFHASCEEGNWKVPKLQTGVIRTNCMDCLDRTNVVQSLFAREVLFWQLRDFCSKAVQSAFQANPLSLPWASGEVTLRSLWADNADAISRLYAGTPALKGDFTRTGKRTKRGALDDGINSVQRYYLNNFLDADRQEGIDLLTCHQGFSQVLAGDDEKTKQKSAKESDQNPTGLSIQDAARQLLAGGSFGNLYSNGNDSEDSDHVRAKLGRETNTHKKALNFIWLPGDIQAQMKSLASHLPHSQHKMLAMDQRSTRELPWWVNVEEEESSSDEESEPQSESKAALPGQSSHAGYVMAALIASSMAPMTTAALVLGVTGSCLSVPKETDDSSSSNETTTN